VFVLEDGAPPRFYFIFTFTRQLCLCSAFNAICQRHANSFDLLFALKEIKLEDVDWVSEGFSVGGAEFITAALPAKVFRFCFTSQRSAAGYRQ